jgi:hypothetical protein
MWIRPAIACILAFATSGCPLISSPGIQAQLQNVTFTYGYGNVPQRIRSGIVSQLKQGTMQITDTRIGGLTGCEARDTANMKFKLHGRWGDPSTNSSLESSVFSMDQVTPSPPAPVCQMRPQNVVQTLTILAGGGSPGLQVGVADTTATVNIVIDNTMYTANNSYVKFVVDSFTQSTDFTTGRFEFLGINSADPIDSRVLVVTGTFAIIED